MVRLKRRACYSKKVGAWWCRCDFKLPFLSTFPLARHQPTVPSHPTSLHFSTHLTVPHPPTLLNSAKDGFGIVTTVHKLKIAFTNGNEALVAEQIKSLSATPVDILMTPQMPAGVQALSKKFLDVAPQFDLTHASSLAAQLCVKLAPRYHFSSHGWSDDALVRLTNCRFRIL